MGPATDRSKSTLIPLPISTILAILPLLPARRHFAPIKCRTLEKHVGDTTSGKLAEIEILVFHQKISCADRLESFFNDFSCESTPPASSAVVCGV